MADNDCPFGTPLDQGGASKLPLESNAKPSTAEIELPTHHTHTPHISQLFASQTKLYCLFLVRHRLLIRDVGEKDRGRDGHHELAE